MILASTPQRPVMTVAQPVWACALGYADPAGQVNSLADSIAQQVARQILNSPARSNFQRLAIDLFTGNRQTVFNDGHTHGSALDSAAVARLSD